MFFLTVAGSDAKVGLSLSSILLKGIVFRLAVSAMAETPLIVNLSLLLKLSYKLQKRNYHISQTFLYLLLTTSPDPLNVFLIRRHYQTSFVNH